MTGGPPLHPAPPSTSQPGTSVIIPAKNAARTLPACLESLASQGVPGPVCELLVVDDASSDATAEIAARSGATVLAGAGKGPAAARNLAARAARGSVLVFLDADTVPKPDWLAQMLKPLSDPQIAAVKGRYFTTQRGLAPRFAQVEFEDKYSRLERAKVVDFVDSGTAAYRREPFLAVGGFDEHFPAQSAEDVELAFRLYRSGARFAFNPRAGVLHEHAQTLGAYLVKKIRYGFFRIRVYRRYPDKAMGDSYTPPAMGLQIALAGLSGIFVFLAACGVSGARAALLGTLALFGVTTAPLVKRARATMPDIAPLVPPLVYLRAWAQGLGIAAALALLVWDRLLGAGSNGK